MTKIPVNPNDEFKPGDVIELNFKLVGPNWLWLRATESTLLESRLKKKYDNFEIKSYEWTEDNSKLAITIRIINPPAIDPSQNRQEAGVNPTIAIICTTIIAGYVLYYFTQDTTYKIVETAAPAISLIALAVIAVVALKLFGKGALAR